MRGSPLGPEFDQWFLRACNRDASLRFGSAIEQVEMLARALNLPTTDATLDALRSNPGASNPGASGDAFGPAGQVSPGSGHYGGETIAQSGHTLVSSSSSMGARVSIAHPQRRKALLYAVFPLAILIVIGVVMFSKKDPAPASTVLATPSPGAPAIVNTAAAMPSPVAAALPSASAEAAPTESAGSAAKPGVLAAAAQPLAPGKRKEPTPPPRPTPARSAPTPGAAHGERGGTNDPLGDQK
jgi:hypothetical protein